ncbi:MAG: hypothetical protein MUF22_03915 [Chitinispirillaceae bacterium]|jgi:hypothetical protein|nr:hypothetical protein [Chitinispirillaceae bacterium]
MLRIIAEIHVSDEREDEIVRKSGLRYGSLKRYVHRKLVDAFRDDRLHAEVKEIKIGPIPLIENTDAGNPDNEILPDKLD